MLILLFFSCTATCEQVCDKLMTCTEIEQGATNAVDCEAACLAQQEEANNDEKEEAFSELKDCLYNNSCSDIADGVCYDEELYSW